MYHPHPPANVLQEIYRDTGVAVKAFSMEGMSHELMNIYPRDVTNNVGLFEALRRIIPLAVLSTMDGHFCLPLLVSEQQCSSLLGKNAATLRGLRFRSGCRIKISQSPVGYGDLEFGVWVDSDSLDALQVAVNQIAPLLAVPASNRRGGILSLIPRVPNEVAHLILFKLDVKDLTRFKLVAKEWNVCINRLNLVKNYYDYKFAKQSGSRILFQNHHAIRAEFMDDNYLSIETNEGVWTDSELHNVPFHEFEYTDYACTSHGLICFFGVPNDIVQYICLWNPITEQHQTYYFREFLLFNEDNVGPHEAFGVKGLYGCSYSHADKDFVVVCMDRSQTQYFTINFISVYGHTILRHNLQLDEDFKKKNSIFHLRGVSMNGSIHWLEKVRRSKGSYYKARVLTYNLEEKNFRDLIVLPEYDYKKFLPLPLEWLDGKLSMVLRRLEDDFTEIWFMNEYGNQESWIHFITISDAYTRPLCISKNRGILAQYDGFAAYQMLYKYNVAGTREWGHEYVDNDFEPLTFVESLFSP